MEYRPTSTNPKPPGVIGIIGSLGGDLLGWIVARICSFVAERIMIHQGLPPYEIFSTPPWLAGSGSMPR